MADLVRNHVGLGKLAGVAVRAAAELVLQIVEERGIEIDALIARTVERPHGRLREGATASARSPRTSAASADDRCGRRRRKFPSSGPRCRPAPRRRICRSGRAASRRRPEAPDRFAAGRPAAGENLRAVEQHARIDAEVPADQSDNDDRADTEAAGSARHAAARGARFAIVFDIVAGTEIIGAHLFTLPSQIRLRAILMRSFSNSKSCHPSPVINQVFPAFIA